MAKSLVKISKRLRDELISRTKELGLSLTDICDDANRRGANISIASLSKYFNNYEKNNLPEHSIIWLAYRYGIFVTLQVGTPVLENQKITFKIPPYDEGMSLKLLKMAFPDVKPKRKIKTKGKQSEIPEDAS